MAKLYGRAFGIPLDYDSMPEHRRLVCQLKKAEVPNPEVMASYIFIQLWQQFAYHAAFEPLGCIPKGDFEGVGPLLCRSLLPNEKLIECLIAARVLYDQDEKYYFSTRFFIYNNEMAQEFRSTQLRFKERRAITYWRNRADSGIARDRRVMVYKPQRLDGKPVKAEMLNSAIITIRTIDAMLRIRTRGWGSFGKGLVDDAIRFCRRLSGRRGQGDLWLIVMQRLAFYAKRADFPRVTETVLAHMDEIIHLIEPEVGWGGWANMLKNKKDEPNPAEAKTNYLLKIDDRRKRTEEDELTPEPGKEADTEPDIEPDDDGEEIDDDVEDGQLPKIAKVD